MAKDDDVGRFFNQILDGIGRYTHLGLGLFLSGLGRAAKESGVTTRFSYRDLVTASGLCQFEQFFGDRIEFVIIIASFRKSHRQGDIDIPFLGNFPDFIQNREAVISDSFKDRLVHQQQHPGIL